METRSFVTVWDAAQVLQRKDAARTAHQNPSIKCKNIACVRCPKIGHYKEMQTIQAAKGQAVFPTSAVSYTTLISE